MPFQSEKQRRFLHANHPEIAKRWERDYANGGISQLVQPGPGRPGYRGDAAYASKSEQSAKSRGGQGQTAEVRGDTGPRDYGETWGYVPPPKKKIIKTDNKEPPIKKKNKTIQTIEDTLKTIGSKIGIHPLLNRRLHYNMALKLPGSRDRVKNYRKKYKEYLDKIGAKSPSTLGDKDLFSFWQSDAFNYQPSTGMDYGAFLIDKYDNPTVTMGGDVGNFYAMEKPDWFDGSDREWETKKRDIIENRGYSMGEGDGQIPLWMELGFNSEDEYLASLADGGVARKNYFHGGVLDINESEEIISDDGNDIELTAYNAEFDDPNDLSTGVKTLFQAKDGGTPQLAKKSKDGKRPGYAGEDWDWSGLDSGGWNPGASSPGTTSTGGNVNQPNIGPSLHGGPSVKETLDTLKEKQHEEAVNTEFEGTVELPYALDLHGVTPSKKQRIEIHNRNIEAQKENYEKALAEQRKKMKRMGLLKLVLPGIMLAAGMPLKYALKGITVSPKDLLTAVKHGRPVAKAKKEYLAALEGGKGVILSEVNIHNPNEMKNIEETTNFTEITNEINNLTPKPAEADDDTGGDGPVLPPQLGGPSTEEMATEYPDWWGAIKEKQAQQKALKEKVEREKLAREENPIVTGTEMDIIALRNSGGLANLFRVKNQ